jgi:hypothetical protein
LAVISLQTGGAGWSENYSDNSIILICFAKNIGRISIFVKKNRHHLNSFQEGQILIIKTFKKNNKDEFFYDVNHNSYIIFDLNKNIGNVNDFLPSIIIKLICKMFYNFIFNLEEINFLLSKTRIFFKIIQSSSENNKIICFLIFEFWVLFFILDSIDIDFTTKIILQKKISLIYKKFLKKNIENQKYLKQIFLYFEKNIWLKIIDSLQNNQPAQKIKNFLRNERYFLFETLINYNYF